MLQIVLTYIDLVFFLHSAREEWPSIILKDHIRSLKNNSKQPVRHVESKSLRGLFCSHITDM